MSDMPTFDPTEITLAVVVATATGNGADVNEFVTMPRLQRKSNHLQVAVLVAGRRCRAAKNCSEDVAFSAYLPSIMPVFDSFRIGQTDTSPIPDPAYVAGPL